MIVHPHLTWVFRVDLFPEKVDIVVFEHGQPPGGKAVVADQRIGNTGGMVAVEAEPRAFQVRFKPDRRLGIGHVGVVGK